MRSVPTNSNLYGYVTDVALRECSEPANLFDQRGRALGQFRHLLTDFRGDLPDASGESAVPLAHLGPASVPCRSLSREIGHRETASHRLPRRHGQLVFDTLEVLHFPHPFILAAGVRLDLRVVNPNRAMFPALGQLQDEPPSKHRVRILNPPDILQDRRPPFLLVLVTDDGTRVSAWSRNDLAAEIGVESLGREAGLNGVLLFYLFLASG